MKLGHRILRYVFPRAFHSAASLILPWGYFGTTARAYNYRAYAEEGFEVNPVVYGCIEKIANAGKNVKLALEYKGEILEEIPEKFKSVATMLERPNPNQSWETFWEEFCIHILIGGMAFMRAYGVGTRTFAGRETIKTSPQLYLVQPDRVEIKHKGLVITGYTIDSKETVSTDEMMHWAFPSPIDQFMGHAPTKSGAVSLDAHNSALMWNKNMLENGGIPLGVFIIKGLLSITPKERAKTIADLKEEYGGAKNAGKPLVVAGEGGEYKPLAQSARELDWTGSKASLMRDICNVFMMPSVLLNDPDNLTWANMVEARKALYTDATLPLMRLYIGEQNHWLMTRFDPDLKIVPITEHIDALKENQTDLVSRLNEAWWLTPNEKRDAMGYKPVIGGDLVLVDFNKAPLVDVVDMAAVKVDAAKKEPEEDPDEEPDEEEEEEPDEGQSIGIVRINAADAGKVLPYVNENTLYPTEETRAARWFDFERRRLRWKKRYMRAVRGFFKSQSARVLEALEGLIQGASDPTRETHDVPPDWARQIVASEAETLGLVLAVKEIQLSLVFEFGEAAINELKKLGLLFDIERPGLTEWLADDIAIRAKDMNLVTADRIQGIINQSIENGEGAARTAERITNSYSQMSRTRAVTIARTEVARASTYATLAGYDQGGVEYKEWLSARDGNERDTHAPGTGMDGQVVRMGENFISPSGAQGQGPGMMGSPSESINCRCTTVPLLNPEEAI